ncbi:MAG: RnfABCDGE type electron transport complex subunit G [Candidatus Cryptobacteroides sp.]
MAVKSSFKNMVICLSVICLVCSALLAAVYALTAEPVKAAAEAKLNKAISQVAPEFDSAPVEATVEVGGKACKYYTVTKGGELAGYAIEASSSGFGGEIRVMVGMTPDGVIYNTSVLSHSETPGLGAKCTEPAFASQFKGFDPSVKSLSVKKDKGDVDAITASTITSRAYCAALVNAVSAYKAITASADPAATDDSSVISDEVGKTN